MKNINSRYASGEILSKMSQEYASKLLIFIEPTKFIHLFSSLRLKSGTKNRPGAYGGCFAQVCDLGRDTKAQKCRNDKSFKLISLKQAI